MCPRLQANRICMSTHQALPCAQEAMVCAPPGPLDTRPTHCLQGPFGQAFFGDPVALAIWPRLTNPVTHNRTSWRGPDHACHFGCTQLGVRFRLAHIMSLVFRKGLN